MSTRTLLIISAAVILAMAAASLWAFGAAPQVTQIAVHWNLAGEAVAYRSKDIALIAPPAIALILALVFATISRGSDVRGRALRAMWLAGLLSLGAVHAFLVLSAAGFVQTFGNYTALFPAVFIGVMGNYLAKRGDSDERGSGPLAHAPARRWLGRLLVLTAVATVATWFVVPGAASEVVLVAGGLGSALIFALVGSSRRDTAHGNGV
jgi:hypothetical protein